MPRCLHSLLLFTLLCFPACRPAPGQAPDRQAQQVSPPIEVHFSPKGGCTEAVVRELNAAKSTVLMQAYSFTSVPIAKALVDAHKRGVKVQAIIDKSQRSEKYSELDFLVDAGIPTQIDTKHAIAHNKIMVIDGQTVITGSFNFTKQAETSNAENLLVIRDKALADKYTANWQAHAEHSDRYEQREQGYSETQKAAATPKPDGAVPQAAGFVSSARSQVFHRADCKSAAKISEKNFVRYSSRDEAIRAGKKPCAECKP
jgi:phosphatidylserine/phosphatidylglycerophosphate/cardiolipin synthase-like enzyme